MFKYRGATCPYCHKELKETDELLICPECGAPYHKDCVKESGGCVLTELHAEGRQWEPPKLRPDTEQFDGMRERRCSRCGTVNPIGNLFCEVCGNPLDNAQPKTEENERDENTSGQSSRESWATPPPQMAYNPFTTPFGGLSPDEEIDNLPIHDLAIYVGENTAYFLPKIKDTIKKERRLPTWNWSAFLFDFYYLIYRKMWGFGILVLLLSTLLSIPSLLIWTEGMTAMLSGTLVFDLGISEQNLLILSNVCSFASLALKLFLANGTTNRIYSRKVCREVKAIRAAHQNDPDYSSRLSAKGGVSRLGLICALGATFILSTVISILITTLLMGI